MFCPKCGSLLLPNKGILACICGYKSIEKLHFKEVLPKTIIEVVDEDAPDGNVEIPLICWNCKKKGVYFWIRQTRSADEPPTRFYKCKHCKKVWRSGK